MTRTEALEKGYQCGGPFAFSKHIIKQIVKELIADGYDDVFVSGGIGIFNDTEYYSIFFKKSEKVKV